MMQKSTIQYLQHDEIDKEKWNACIAASLNGLIYAYAWYLDAMAGDWDALVLNDYECVMPLPYRRKFGLYYLYHPFLMAQLGLFGTHFSNNLLENFLHSIPKKFRYWDFPLNYQNVFLKTSYPVYVRNNFVLNLNLPYDEIYTNYRENIRRNIKKSVQYGPEIKKNISIHEITALAKLQSPDIAKEDFTRFETLFAQQPDAVCYGIYSTQGQLLASAAFLFSHKRAYYILVGNHPNGRTLGASHALINAFIKDHAGRELLLDFEGSDIRNLAFFYSSFGAREEPYAAIRLNRLPWWMRWLKK